MFVSKATTFRVCYCAVLAAGCDSDSKFGVEIESIVVRGPQMDSTLDCKLSEPCTVQITGTGFLNSNKLLILESGDCGDAAPTVFTATGIKETFGLGPFRMHICPSRGHFSRPLPP